MKELTLQSCLAVQKEVDAVTKHLKEYNPRKAARGELAEMERHQGYESWKPVVIDMKQAYMELVDTFAFAMSWLIIDGRVAQYPYFVSYMCGETIIDMAYKSISDGNPHCLINDVFNLNRTLFGKTDADLFYYYMSKQALFSFRRDNGYGEGTYIKIWNGKEDNEYLTMALESNIEIDDIDAYLNDAYNAVIKEV